MKGLIITNKGIEDIACLEVKELIKAKSTVKDTVVLFEFSKKEAVDAVVVLTARNKRTGINAQGTETMIYFHQFFFTETTISLLLIFF